MYSIAVVLGTLNPPGPDGKISTSASSFVSSSAQNAADTSSTPLNASTTGTSSTSSAGSSVFGGGGSSSSSGGSVSGTSSMDLSSVPYDLKSPANPHWTSFLREVATQTSRDLADLQANAVNDPAIGVMWDVYVQTIGDGAALPSGAGTVTDTTGGAEAGAVSGPKMSLYEGGGQPGATGPISSPSVNNNWFQSFFKDPAETARSNQMMNSFTQLDPSQPASTAYDSGVSANSFGSSSSGNSGSPSGPTFSGNTQYGSSSPSFSPYSMEQVFSKFRRPSSSQQQQQYYQQQQPYQQQQQAPQQYQQQSSGGMGMNPMDYANRFYSMMSQLAQTTNQQSSQGTGSQLGQGSSLPDAGWSVGGSPPQSSGPTQQQQQQQQQQQPQQTSNPLPMPSAATMQQLSDELMRVLGKLPMTGDSSNPSSSSSSSSTQQAQPPRTPTPAQPQTQTQTAQFPSLSHVPGRVTFNTDLFNTPNNQVQLGNGQTSGYVPPFGDLGVQKSGIMVPDLRPLSLLPSRMALLKPVANFYTARFKAR